jgi:hypothetical protein
MKCFFLGGQLMNNFIENKFVNRKLEKGGWSVPRAPVLPLCIGYTTLTSLTLEKIENAL